jgi:hypothetical protein
VKNRRKENQSGHAILVHLFLVCLLVGGGAWLLARSGISWSQVTATFQNGLQTISSTLSSVTGHH